MGQPLTAPPRGLRLVASSLVAAWDSVEVHLQPIVDVATGSLFAAEALARFPALPVDSPSDVFAGAYASGHGVDLEVACLRAALATRDRLPDGVRISVNVSPDVLTHQALRQCWSPDLDGVIIEVTEHRTSDPTRLSDELAHLRRRGAAIAIDDVSTGYAGLLRLATLRPDFVKVDRQIIAGVRDSIAQTAVLEALVGLSHRLGATVIGEGVECIDDLSALAEFDVDYAQGYAIARPALELAAIPTVISQTCLAGRRHLLRRAAPVGRPAAHTRDMHAVTAALARVVEHADLHDAIVRAGFELDVDVIAVSALGDDRCLREVAVCGADLDSHSYAVADFPATALALRTGVSIEAHVNDPLSDPAEQAVLARLGQASLLLVPLCVSGRPIGLLELAHRTNRRWSSHDIANAHGLAEHLRNVLQRITA
jgi:EAL domain-containing protein (putative c-di-GMP-specific phosphodiesterase class I)